MTIAAEEFLSHYGVKGMKWGVRKDQGSGVHRLQGPVPTVDSALHPSTAKAATKVAALMAERYGLHIGSIKSMGPGHPEYDMGALGYVEHTPGQRAGTINVSQGDLRKRMKAAEDIGWVGKGCGSVEGLVTHEAGHAVFHAEQKLKLGLTGIKEVGGNHEARNKALKAASKQAKQDGIRPNQLTRSISGYAAASGTREEAEAEMLSQYHWSPNPPRFVKVWGETLHREMGIDPTPFREERKNG